MNLCMLVSYIYDDDVGMAFGKIIAHPNVKVRRTYKRRLKVTGYGDINILQTFLVSQAILCNLELNEVTQYQYQPAVNTKLI